MKFEITEEENWLTYAEFMRDMWLLYEGHNPIKES